MKVCFCGLRRNDVLMGLASKDASSEDFLSSARLLSRGCVADRVPVRKCFALPQLTGSAAKLQEDALEKAVIIAEGNSDLRLTMGYRQSMMVRFRP